MTIYLKQSTASQEVPLGHFVDSTDGNTEETALTIANTDIKLWKSGATTLASKNSGGATHISNGVYYCTLDATDTNTLGPLVLYVHVAGALAVRVECCVLASNVYDSLIGGGDVLDVSVTQWLGSAAATPTTAGVPEVDVTHWLGAAAATPTNAGVPEVDVTHVSGAAVSTAAAQLGVNAVQAGGTAWGSGAITSGAFAAGAITASAIAADAIGASELAADAVAEIADAVWDEATSGHVTASTFGRALGGFAHAGTAQAGAAGTITLAASASATDDAYNGMIVLIGSGAGYGQWRLVSDYVGATKVATVASNWATTPDSTSAYVVLAN